MATLGEKAQAYEKPKTKNIAELEKVPTDLEVTTETHTNKDGEPFSQDVISFQGSKYRVPVSVLENLQAILKATPNLKFFKVVKTGEGMGTKYTVVPLPN